MPLEEVFFGRKKNLKHLVSRYVDVYTVKEFLIVFGCVCIIFFSFFLAWHGFALLLGRGAFMHKSNFFPLKNQFFFGHEISSKK